MPVRLAIIEGLHRDHNSKEFIVVCEGCVVFLSVHSFELLASQSQDDLILLFHKANHLVLFAVACWVVCPGQEQNCNLGLSRCAEHSDLFHSSKHSSKIAIIK